jgi:N6-L-threonylcarbamoyladenine synthase
VLVERERAVGHIFAGQDLADLCASVQKAIVDALVSKAMLACRRKQVLTLVLGGGVAANSLLRSEAARLGADNDVRVYVPEKALCTDNAVMIGSAALAWRRLGKHSALSLMAQPDARVEDSGLALNR